MTRRPTGSTRTDHPFPYPTRFRSAHREERAAGGEQLVDGAPEGPDLRVLAVARVPGAGADDDEVVAVERAGLVLVVADHGRGHAHHREHVAQHVRSEEHTSELQSLMRISYAVFCLKTKNK